MAQQEHAFEEIWANQCAHRGGYGAAVVAYDAAHGAVPQGVDEDHHVSC